METLESNTSAYTSDYAEIEPAQSEIDQLDQPALIEFGSPWCGYSRAAQPLLKSALAAYPQIRHFKIADGSGRPLGRSFGVKLWPTLVFVRHGREVARLVRPTESGRISQALAEIDALG